MGFDFRQLHERTRGLMLDELNDDILNESLYYPKRLLEPSQPRYLEIAREAFIDGTPETFARELEPVPGSLWIPHIFAKNGRKSPTPVTAPTTAAEGEFNRYYMRAVCRQSISEGDSRVCVYRAKVVINQRAGEKVSVGDYLEAPELLADPRENRENTLTGMPRGPNSGLSIYVP